MTTEKLMKLVVCYVNNKPMGMFTQQKFMSYNGRKWWESVKTLMVPSELYYGERVNISNVDRYVEMYEDNPKYYTFL